MNARRLLSAAVVVGVLGGGVAGTPRVDGAGLRPQVPRVEGRLGRVPTVEELVRAAGSGPVTDATGTSDPTASVPSDPSTTATVDTVADVGNGNGNANGHDVVRVLGVGPVGVDGGTVAAPGMSVSFAGVDSALDVTISEPATRPGSVGVPVAGAVVLVGPFDVSATDDSGVDVHSFPASYSLSGGTDGVPLTAENVVPGVALSIDVPAAVSEGVDPASVGVWTRESDGDEWVWVPSFLDVASSTVRAELDHLSQFVVIGTPAVPAPGPRVALDPDDDIGEMTWPADGSVSELPLSIETAQAVAAKLVSQCRAQVLVTRSTPVPQVLSPSVRAGMINAFGAVATVGLAYNTNHMASDPPASWDWGNAGDGGLHTFARGGNVGDETLAGQLVTEWLARTGRPSNTLNAAGIPFFPTPRYAAMNALSGSYAHVELGFLDHRFDWPVIRDQRAGAIADVVFTGLAVELQRQGFACDGVTPSGLPTRPDPARMRLFKQLGYRYGSPLVGDPVSMPSGNLLESFDLFSLSGPGEVSTGVSLTYNSMDDRQGRFGIGMWSNVDARLQRFADGGVMVVRGDGASFMFEPDGAGGYTPEQGTLGTLSEAGGGWLRLQSPDGMVMTFDASGAEGIGWLQSVQTRDGHTLTFTYGAASATAKVAPLASITDDAGQIVTFASDVDGRVTGVSTPDGRAWAFTYTAAGELASIGYPDGTARSFTYDGAHRMVTLTDGAGVTYLTNTFDAAGRVIGQVDGLGASRSWIYDVASTTYVDTLGAATVYGFDANGNVTSIVDASGTVSFTFDGNGMITSEVDQDGRTTTYSYDPAGRLTGATDPTGATTAYSYAPSGELLAVSDPGGVGGATRTESYVYNAQGLPTSHTMVDGTTESWTYTTAGDVATAVDAAGSVDGFEYDSRGNLTGYVNALGARWTFAYDGANRLVQTVAPDGGVTGYGYDVRDRVVAVTAPDGGTTSYVYDVWDRVTAATDPLGATTTYSYDVNGRLLAVTGPDGATVAYGYNSEDVVTQIVDPLGRTTTIGLDAARRPVTITDPAGGVTTNTLDGAGLVHASTDPSGATSTTDFDGAGRPVRFTDPAGVTAEIVYDAVGRPVQTVRGDGVTVSDTLFDVNGRPAAVTYADGSSEGFRYDTVGNMVEYIDQRGYSWLFRYDAVGQLVEAEDPTGGVTSYAYTSVGNLDSVTDATGAVTRYAYSTSGDLLSTTAPDGTVTAAAYDAAGRPVTATDTAGGVTTYTYDSVGRITAVTDPAGITVKVVYDAAGQVVADIDGRGTVTAYNYDMLGRTVEMIRNAQPGAPATADVNVTTSAVYDAVGNVVEMIDPNGGRTVNSFDVAGRITGTSDPLGRETTLTYDDLGRPAVTTLPDGTTITANYDDAGRLVKQVWSGGHHRSYQYDAAGDVTAVIDPTGALHYDYDPAGRVASETDSVGNVTDYGYDSAGRETLKVLANGVTVTTGRDAAGRAVRTEASNGIAADYRYDPAGRLAEITRSNDLTTTFGYDVLGRVVETRHEIPDGATPDPAVTYNATSTGPERDLADWGYARLAKPSVAVTSGSVTETVAYDENSNVTATTRTIDAGLPDAMVTPGSLDTPASVTETFGYDPLNRLTDTIRNGVASTFGYDANGNRTSWTTADDPGTPTVVDAVTATATFDAGNQITTNTVTGPDGTTATAYTYNLRGARTSEATTRPDGTEYRLDYTYDELSRLTGVTRAGRTTATVYDAADRAITTTATTPYGDTTAEWTHSGWDPTSVARQGHPDVTVIDDAFGYPLAEHASDDGDPGTDRWLVTSTLGDIIGTANQTGALTQLADASAYGTSSLPTDRWNTMQTWTGELGTLTADDQVSYHQRPYQPDTATWTQQDALAGRNRHNYLNANPANGTDAYGYQRQCIPEYGPKCAPSSGGALRQQKTAQAVIGAVKGAAPPARPPIVQLIDGIDNVKPRSGWFTRAKASMATAVKRAAAPRPREVQLQDSLDGYNRISATHAGSECLANLDSCSARQLTDAVKNNPLLFGIIDVANQGDIGKSDGNWSSKDLAAAIDGRNLDKIIGDLARQSNLNLSDAQAAQLKSIVQGVAGRLQGHSDLYEAIDHERSWLERNLGTIVTVGSIVAGAVAVVATGGVLFFGAQAIVAGGIQLGAVATVASGAGLGFSALNVVDQCWVERMDCEGAGARLGADAALFGIGKGTQWLVGIKGPGWGLGPQQVRDLVKATNWLLTTTGYAPTLGDLSG